MGNMYSRKIEFFWCPQMPMNKGFLKSVFCENDAGECKDTWAV